MASQIGVPQAGTSPRVGIKTHKERRTRGLGVAFVALGVVVGALAGAWNPAVAPALTKMPTNVSGTLDLSGTYTGYVDRSTGVALKTPQAAPLTIHQTIAGQPDLSTSDVVIARETDVSTIAGQASTVQYQYAVNRSTSVNVDDPKAWAYSAGTPVNRTGSYSVSLPQSFSTSQTYSQWSNDIGQAVPLTYLPDNDQTINGVAVKMWRQSFTDEPLSPAVIAANKLPTSIPFSAFTAQLKAAGIDLAGGLTSLAPVLTPAELATLQGLSSGSVPVIYTDSGVQDVLWDAVTGAPVKVVQYTFTYSSKPDLRGLSAAVGPIFAAHPSAPAVQKLAPAFAQLKDVKAKPLFSVDAQTTSGSDTSNATTAQNNARLLGLVQTTLPIGLGVLAILLVVGGISLMYRRGNQAR